jgi:hypothetical protein
VLTALLLALALLPSARADRRDGFRDPLSDQIEVVVVDREVVAIDAEGSGDRSAELSLRESVGFHAARGIVGAALTSERALFFSANRGWLSLRWLPGEQVPERVLLGERVALLATSKRVIGFNAESGIAVDESIGRSESVHDLAVGANAGAALTSRRLLGLSLGSSRFIEEKIGVNEPVESLDAGANIITAKTPRRLLIFRATGASWEERPRRLR